MSATLRIKMMSVSLKMELACFCCQMTIIKDTVQENIDSVIPPYKNFGLLIKITLNCDRVSNKYIIPIV